jgi:hypothetical protein
MKLEINNYELEISIFPFPNRAGHPEPVEGT